MQRYLLFDSDCAACTDMAQSIEQIAGEWVTLCSLRHPRMMRLLDQANPNWTWEPTLLETEEDEIRAFTGISLAVKVTLGLGLPRALRVLKVVAVTTRAKTGVTSLSRRTFLGQSVAFLTWLALPGFIRRASTEHAMPERPRSADIGELYGGFVLLPDGAPVPVDVSDYKGFPNPCGVVEPGGTAHTQPSDAVHIGLSDARSLSEMGGFPVYALKALPRGLKSLSTSLVKHGTGEVHGGYLGYKAFDARNRVDFTALTIAMEKGFPRPYPLWSTNPVEENGPAVRLEKVKHVPGGEGILIRTAVGFDLHWIQHDVLYSLSAEGLEGIEPRELSELLEPVS